MWYFGLSQLHYVAGVALGEEIKFVVIAKKFATALRNTRLGHHCRTFFFFGLSSYYLLSLTSYFQVAHWRSGHKTDCQRISSGTETSAPSSNNVTPEIQKGWYD